MLETPSGLAENDRPHGRRFLQASDPQFAVRVSPEVLGTRFERTAYRGDRRPPSPGQIVTPIPKPKKQKKAEQKGLEFEDETKGLSDGSQRYDPTPIINELRQHVDRWRELKSPDQWMVTPETARLLQHWRHHEFGAYRPFFCQVEAIETLIWLTSAMK